MSNIVHLCVHNKPAIGNCFTRMEKRQFEDWYPPPHPPCPLLPGEKQVLLVPPLQLLYHKLLITNHSNSGLDSVWGTFQSKVASWGQKYLSANPYSQPSCLEMLLFIHPCLALAYDIAYGWESDNRTALELRMMSSVQCHLMLDHFDSQFSEMLTRVPMQHW